MLRTRLLASVTPLTIGLSACGSNAPTAPPNGGIAGVHLGTADVHISATDQNTFDSAMVKATVGEIIEWKNTGPVNHDIVFSNDTSSGEFATDSEPALRDPALLPGGAWQVKFSKAGTYAYQCTIHPGMVGTIVVISG